MIYLLHNMNLFLQRNRLLFIHFHSDLQHSLLRTDFNRHSLPCFDLISFHYLGIRSSEIKVSSTIQLSSLLGRINIHPPVEFYHFTVLSSKCCNIKLSLYIKIL